MTDQRTLPTPMDADTVRQPWQGIARVLMLLVGASLLAGAVYFTFFAAPEDGGVASAFDGFVAVWALTVAVGLLVVAALPRGAVPSWAALATGVVLAHLVWGLIKLVAYDELPQSLTSLAVDAVILAVLWAGRRPSR